MAKTASGEQGFGAICALTKTVEPEAVLIESEDATPVPDGGKEEIFYKLPIFQLKFFGGLSS